MPLPVFAEGRSGQSGNAGLVQKTVGKFVTWYTSAADVGKKIERTKRLQTTDTRNAVQAIRKHIPALSKFCNHLLSGLLRFRRTSLSRRRLRKCGGARDAIVHEKLDCRKHVFRDDAVAQSPACHGINLGKAIHKKNLIENVRYIKDARRPVSVVNLGVDLIGKN